MPIMSDEIIPSAEVAVRETPRRHMRLRLLVALRPSTGRRRVWSRMADLERDLELARRLNTDHGMLIEQLHAELQSATKAAWNAIDRADNLERQLALAVEANESNAHRTNFAFVERPMEPGEDVTYPVPVGELLIDDDEDTPEVVPVLAADPVPMIEPPSTDDEDVDEVASLDEDEDEECWPTVVIPTGKTSPTMISMSTTGSTKVMLLNEAPFATVDPALITHVLK